jgi:hypothetical protein
MGRPTHNNNNHIQTSRCACTAAKRHSKNIGPAKGDPTPSRCERSCTQSQTRYGAMASPVRTLLHHTGAAAHGSRCCAVQNHRANRRAGFGQFRVAAASRICECAGSAGVRVPQGSAGKRNHVPVPKRTSPPPLQSHPNRPLLYGHRRTTVRHQHTLNADESNALHTLQ